MTLNRVGVWPLGSHFLSCTRVLDAPRGSLTALLLPVCLNLGYVKVRRQMQLKAPQAPAAAGPVAAAVDAARKGAG